MSAQALRLLSFSPRTPKAQRRRLSSLQQKAAQLAAMSPRCADIIEKLVDRMLDELEPGA